MGASSLASNCCSIVVTYLLHLLNCPVEQIIFHAEMVIPVNEKPFREFLLGSGNQVRDAFRDVRPIDRNSDRWRLLRSRWRNAFHIDGPRIPCHPPTQKVAFCCGYVAPHIE
eukprot:GEMP01072367.1.p1 GENE.GEMP01072367.1~~GEMP01072367.1.p1  ORF type:complete len:112 (-),score=17.70 GEMP01072367.1:171-506(-)